MANATTYAATQNADGTFAVRDVPIMGEVPKGAKGNENGVTRKWLEAALAKCKTRAAEGYMPPLHLRHHEWGERAESAGQWVATEVREIDYDGGKMFALFADLVSVKPDVMAAIQRGDWPYRSVEVHSYTEHEIGSLALLDSEAPFFKFPILRVSEPLLSDDAPNVDEWPAQMTTPFQGSATHDGSLALALFKFGPAAVAKLADVPPVPPKEDEPNPAASAKADEAPAAADEEEGDEETPEVEAAPQWATDLGLKLDKILSLIAPPVPPTAEPAAQAPVAAPPVAKVSMSATDEGELVARRAADSAREKIAAVDAICGRAVAKLRSYQLAPETLADIRKLAEKGEDAVHAFCATYERVAPKDPPRRLEDVVAGGVLTDPPEVAAFAAKGPTALEQARAAVPKFEALKASGFRRTLAEFLSTEVRA